MPLFSEIGNSTEFRLSECGEAGTAPHPKMRLFLSDLNASASKALKLIIGEGSLLHAEILKSWNTLESLEGSNAFSLGNVSILKLLTGGDGIKVADLNRGELQRGKLLHAGEEGQVQILARINLLDAELLKGGELLELVRVGHVKKAFQS